MGVSGEIPYSTEIDIGHLKPSPANAALRYLWARHRIAVLADYNRLRQRSDDGRDGRIKEVTDLGLNYNLLTAYTSFIAVDSLKRLKEGQATTVKQPLPLPQGVADTAVGVRGIMAPKAAAPEMAYLKPPPPQQRYKKAYGAVKRIAPKQEISKNKQAELSFSAADEFRQVPESKWKKSEKKLANSSHSAGEELREGDKAPEPDAIASVERKHDKTQMATPAPTVIPAKDKPAVMRSCIKIGSITVTGNTSKSGRSQTVGSAFR